jgi:hypothetical protein
MNDVYDKLPKQLAGWLIGMIIILLSLYLWVQYTKPAASPERVTCTPAAGEEGCTQQK